MFHYSGGQDGTWTYHSNTIIPSREYKVSSLLDFLLLTGKTEQDILNETALIRIDIKGTLKTKDPKHELSWFAFSSLPKSSKEKGEIITMMMDFTEKENTNDSGRYEVEITKLSKKAKKSNKKRGKRKKK